MVSVELWLHLKTVSITEPTGSEAFDGVTENPIKIQKMLMIDQFQYLNHHKFFKYIPALTYTTWFNINS